MSTAQEKRNEHSDTVNIPSWIASIVAIGASIRSGSVGFSSSDINEFVAVFTLCFIAFTKIAIAVNRDRFRVHGMVMLWIGAGILSTIAVLRMASHQGLLSTADNRIIVGWSYFVWAIILTLSVNRFRIKRWLLANE